MAYLKIVTKRGTQALANRLAYIARGDKTEDSLITTYHLSKNTAYATLQMETYYQTYSVSHRHPISSKMIIQSFDPQDHVSPAKAHEIAKELVKRLGLDRCQCYITTHTDKKHIHNHIVFHPRYVDTGKRVRDDRQTLTEYRAMNDIICKDHGLLTIDQKREEQIKRGERPLQRSMTHYEWQENLYFRSYKQSMANAVDALIPRARDYDHLLMMLRWKFDTEERGKSLRMKSKRASRWIRTDSFGLDYSREAIQQRILLEQQRIFLTRRHAVDMNRYNSRGWKQYALGQNLTQMNDLYRFLSSHHIASWKKLDADIQKASDQVHQTSVQFKALKEEIQSVYDQLESARTAGEEIPEALVQKYRELKTQQDRLNSLGMVTRRKLDELKRVKELAQEHPLLLEGYPTEIKKPKRKHREETLERIQALADRGEER